MSVVRAFHMAKQSNTTLEKSIDETQRKNQLIERQRIPYIAAEQVVLRIASAAAAFCSIRSFHKRHAGIDILSDNLSIGVHGI